MSTHSMAQTSTPRHDLDAADHDDHEDHGDLVAIRRNLLLSGVVGGLAGLLGAAFLARGSWALDTPFGLLMLAIAALNLAGLLSARVPVLVADEQGIRLRLGPSWRGLPWSSIRQVVVEHPESPLREGRLVVVPRDLAAGDSLTPFAKAHLRWNRIWYGAPMSVPLGMSTFADTPDLAADLRALAQGRVDVADLRGQQLAQLDEVPVRAREIAPLPPEDGAVALLEPADFEPADIEELPPPPEDDLDEEVTAPVIPPPPVAPLREISQPMRVDVVLPRREQPLDGPDLVPVEERPDVVPDIAPADDPDPIVAREHLDSEFDPALAFAAEAMEDGVEPTVSIGVQIPGQRRPGEIAELLAGGELHAEAEVEAAPGPVIGTKITHAREMLDMSIDELSQRTRIRPHVLEAMERDDFGPCGGDVYARGHITSVARILGLTLEPLMEIYEERYAQGPINARRVFEADLSTGLSGGMRATLGGPRWSLMITAVLCLTMVWGMARIFFAEDPERLNAAPAPSSQVAGLAGNKKPITSPLTKTSTITVTAKYAATRVVVRDRTGRVIWSGDLTLGGKRTIAGMAPFKVQADNGGAVEVSRKGKSLGTVGMAGVKGTKKF